MKYLSVGNNAKTAKSDALGEYVTAILYFAPATLSGTNVCPWSTAGCRSACLNLAGRGIFQNVQDARIRKTRDFFDRRKLFITALCEDIATHVKQCKRAGKKPAVRLNGTSDILWERIAPEIFTRFPDVTFYDYTKCPFGLRKLPPNYHLTYSGHEEMSPYAFRRIYEAGENTAVVFHGKELPKTFAGLEVINGDAHDLRFLDRKGVIVGLLAKGPAKRDRSGFVMKAKGVA